ncbi:MAG: hypothetical protein K0R44_2348 [Thermomicrobiales bacterium]|nr:hypothetical protein [Thermomicrobiales bacterium]
MARISDPSQIDHPDLREFGIIAAWVPKLEDTVGVLEELVADFVDEEQGSGLDPWDEDPLEVALSVVHTNDEVADQALEARVSAWLVQDPEHWSIFRLVVLDPWQEQTRAVAAGHAGLGMEPRDQHRACPLPAGSLWAAARGRLERHRGTG